MDVWNFHLAGRRVAISQVARFESGFDPARAPMEQLRGHWQDPWPETFMSPFLMLLWQARFVRVGGRIGYGLPPGTRWVDEQESASVLARADRELTLEEERRSSAPNEVSRLACVYAAENTPVGRAFVEGVVGRESFVVPVRVTAAAAVTRCDARWLDDVGHTPGAAAAYWAGGARGDEPLWEYLIDGTVECADPDDLDRIRTFVRTKGPPPDLIAKNP